MGGVIGSSRTRLVRPATLFGAFLVVGPSHSALAQDWSGLEVDVEKITERADPSWSTDAFDATAKSPASNDGMFDPAVDGFSFANAFPPLDMLVPGVASHEGLGAGMVYAALDYYHAGVPVPSHTADTLVHHIRARERQALLRNIDRWADHGLNPMGTRSRALFRRGMDPAGELGRLKTMLDAGQPVPLGLQQCGRACACGAACAPSHVVLAVSYDAPDSTTPTTLTIRVYDPTHPGETRELTANPLDGWYGYPNQPERRWRSFFVDSSYRPDQPPAIGTEPLELP